MSENIRYRAAVIEHMSQIAQLKSLNVPPEIIDGLTNSFNRTCQLAKKAQDIAYQQGFIEGERDPMTSLPRRGGLKIAYEAQENHDRRRKAGTNFALVLDVESLKLVNDNPILGYSVGDDIIVAMSEIIKSVTRRNDISARLGGDEFVVLLPDTTSDFANIQMPARIIEAHQRMGCINSPIGPIPFNFRYTTIELPEQASYEEIERLLNPKMAMSKREIQHPHRELADFPPTI